MKNTLAILFLGLCQIAIAQTVDIEITSPQANKLEVYLTPNPAGSISLSEVTFTLKRPVSCNATLASLTSTMAGLNFNNVTINPPIIESSNSFVYEGFAASPNTFPALTARTKVLTLDITGSTAACQIRIEDAPNPLLINGTLNIVNNLGLTVNGTVTNNANAVVLPVELLSFQGEKANEKTNLKWEVVNEVDLASYVVERSIDGSSFKAIGSVSPKAKTIQDRVAYSFLDEKPDAGINYYRLQFKSKSNNDEKLSKIISVDFGSNIKGKAYPNPVVYDLSLEVDIEKNVSGVTIVDILDVQGKLVFTQQVKSTGRKLTLNIPTDSMAAGAYVLRLTNSSHVWQHKFTKQ